jgi:hypothetical protein
MLAILVLLPWRRLKSGMPVAGNCSAAISAACHHPAVGENTGVSHLPLQWGELCTVDGKGDEAYGGIADGLDGEDGGGSHGIGWRYEYLARPYGQQRGPKRRCAFSHTEVHPPVDGAVYS